MSRRPPAISLDELREAARSAVANALEERTTALTRQEARDTSGGAAYPVGPVLSGMAPYPGIDPYDPYDPCCQIKPATLGMIAPSPTLQTTLAY